MLTRLMKRVCHRLSFACAIVLAAGLSPPGSVTYTAAVADWHQWRGPNRDGHSLEARLLQSWPEGGPPLAWRAKGAGTGYSSMSFADGRLFTLGARGNAEFVLAFDAATGNELWATPHGRRYTNMQGDGPRSTPTVDASRLYAFGASGDLSCLEVETGRIVWTVNVLERFKAFNIPWGLSESPLVVDDRVLVSPGGPGAAFAAFNKDDGSLLWSTASDTAGYASAVLQRVGDLTTAVFFTADRVAGLDVRDGRLLWSYPGVINYTANVATPVVRDRHVFVSSNYDTGGALLEITPTADGAEGREVYFTDSMHNHHSTSVLVGDYLYGFSNSILTALAFDSARVAWRHRSVGKGSLVYADGRLYLFSEDGVVGLAEATADEYREVGRFRIQTGSHPTWSHPAISNGRLYLRDQDTIYAYEIKGN